MAQFIHLSLLLAATIQLPLVSVTQIQLREGTSVTFKCHQTDKGDVHRTCESLKSMYPRVNVTNYQLRIDNLTHADSRNYTCWCNSGNDILNLTLIVTTGCINDRLDNFDFSHKEQEEQRTMTEHDCKRLCTENSTCEYFTFKKGQMKCFLIPSKGLVRIQKNPTFVSGYPSRGNCNENDDAVRLQFHKEPKSWFEALKDCRDEHFSLVQITNSTMQLKVKSLLQNQSSSMQAGVWIGLERSMFGKCPIPWKWISGSEIGKTDQWNSSFPVDSLNNHCGKIIQVNETDFKWLDAWCHDELPFICQDAA